MTPRVYREQEQIYAEEIERGVDSDVLAEIGFRPLASASIGDVSAEGVASEVVETGTADESTAPPDTEDVAAVPEDMAWQHEAYAEYLAQQDPERSPHSPASHAPKAGRKRSSSRRLTGRAALFAEGRGTDPDLM